LVGLEPDEFIFSSQWKDKPIVGNAIEFQFRIIARKLFNSHLDKGADDYRKSAAVFHGLRHTFCSKLAIVGGGNL